MSGNMLVGFTGHQNLTDETSEKVRGALLHELSLLGPSKGFCSLASGADQIFARCLIEAGGELVVVVPCSGYEKTFIDKADLKGYHELREAADTIVQLDFDKPDELAFWAAGKRVVDESDILFAVWDGKPSGGIGGTADVVDYATNKGHILKLIWPDGSARGEPPITLPFREKGQLHGHGLTGDDEPIPP